MMRTNVIQENAWQIRGTRFRDEFPPNHPFFLGFVKAFARIAPSTPLTRKCVHRCETKQMNVLPPPHTAALRAWGRSTCHPTIPPSLARVGANVRGCGVGAVLPPPHTAALRAWGRSTFHPLIPPIFGWSRCERTRVWRGAESAALYVLSYQPTLAKCRASSDLFVTYRVGFLDIGEVEIARSREQHLHILETQYMNSKAAASSSC